MVAVGSDSAGTHIVHLDGGYGGTGAAPDIAKKNIAMPIEYGIVKVHRFLTDEGIRDKVTLIASGGLRTSHDIAKAIALGADGVVVGSALVKIIHQHRQSPTLLDEVKNFMTAIRIGLDNSRKTR
jgi:glutamate synthase domain-containing protein 2